MDPTTYIQDLLLDLDLGGLHEKHVVATSSVHYTTCCNTQSSTPEDG